MELHNEVESFNFSLQSRFDFEGETLNFTGTTPTQYIRDHAVITCHKLRGGRSERTYVPLHRPVSFARYTCAREEKSV